VSGAVQVAVTILLFVLILGGLVLVHEVGHFVAARVARVRVLEFGIGFPPRAKVIQSSGETLYTLNWLPIGGFVKLEGEDGDAADDPRSFAVQRLWVRVAILAAGAIMNVVIAFAIFTGIALYGDPTFGVIAGTVQPDSPAATAGIRPGDIIESVDGTYFGAFGSSSILQELRDRAGQTVSIGVHRATGEREILQVTLRGAADVAAGRGALGIGGLEARTTDVRISHPAGEAIGLGWDRTTTAMGLILDGLGQLGSAIVSRPTEPPPAAGPVGIAVQIGDVFFTLGPLVTLYLAGVLSANLAIVNILPFPPLDGGRILVIVLKAVFGSRISARAERLTYLVGFMLLFAFLIWITGFDLIRSLGGG
jgi:regulator of sigma E protease